MTTATKKAPPLKKAVQPEGRRVMVSPNHYVSLTPSVQPKTKLGNLALQLDQQSSAALLSISAISGYVYALTQAAAPSITFTDTPPGFPSTLTALQSSYDGFLTQFALFQGQASAWINTQQGTSTASIFSQLVSVPSTLSSLNSTVSANFTLLNALTPGSAPYQSTLSQQETLIGAEAPAISGLITSMQSLGTALENAATSLVNSTQSDQVLGQLLAAYAADIAALNADIASAQSQISSDNSKIIGLGFGAAAAIAVGLVGLANFWNPVGWIMMAGGAIGAYYAIVEIESLKAQIANLKAQISADTDWVEKDTLAAQLVSAFCTQLQGFTSLNAAAQQELTTLESLYSTIAADITAALSDLSANELAEAQAEWNTILAAGQTLQNLTAYIWPSPVMLSHPSSFAAISSDIYSIALSGELFHYSGAGNSWTDMNVKALSVAGQGTTLVAIDGAPIDGTVVSPNPTASTYFVKSYNMTSQSWTTISSFPAAGIAVGGSTVYAISQIATDRQVYQYSGTGTTWTALAQLPGPDAAIQIAVAGGVLFALANNSMFVYQYNASSNSWTQVGTSTCCSIQANGNDLAIIDTQNNTYLYDATAGGTPTQMGSPMIQVAQLSNGNQYCITNTQSLSLIEPTNPPTVVGSIASSVVTVFASDTNNVYYADASGNMYSLSASNVSTLLPVMPS